MFDWQPPTQFFWATKYLFLHRSVTLERFFVVVYPLKKFRMKKFLLPIVAAFSLLYNLPKVSKQLRWEKGFLSVYNHYQFWFLHSWFTCELSPGYHQLFNTLKKIQIIDSESHISLPW